MKFVLQSKRPLFHLVREVIRPLWKCWQRLYWDNRNMCKSSCVRRD